MLDMNLKDQFCNCYVYTIDVHVCQYFVTGYWGSIEFLKLLKSTLHLSVLSKCGHVITN